METTYDSSQSSLSNNGRRAKSELSDSARKAADSASAEFKNFVSDVEDVVKKVAHVSDADVARARAKIQAAISSTKSGFASGAESVKVQAQQAAKYADDYVRESPWQAIGVGAAVAAVLGLSIGYLAARR